MNLALVFSRKYNWPELREKCPYSELFWSAFSRIWTDYGEILRISPYLVRMRENADQNNCEYGHILRSVENYVSIICSGNSWEIFNKKLNFAIIIFANLIITFLNLFSNRFLIIVKEVNQIRNNIVCFVTHHVFAFSCALTTGSCNVF